MTDTFKGKEKRGRRDIEPNGPGIKRPVSADFYTAPFQIPGAFVFRIHFHTPRPGPDSL